MDNTVAGDSKWVEPEEGEVIELALTDEDLEKLRSGDHVAYQVDTGQVVLLYHQDAPPRKH